MNNGIHFREQLATSPGTFTVNNFVKAWTDEQKSLILRPPFQRNLVWNNQQKSYLVDSILRGFPVPEVYIQLRTDADGQEEIVIVDGQQRISTCIDFVLGNLQLSSDEELDPKWRLKRFEELDPDLRSKFRSFQFVARQLPDVEPSVLRDIFRRLNRTVESLEPQELRHAAYTGQFISLVEDAAQAQGWTELSIFTSRDISRRRHDEFVSEVFYAYALGTFPNKKDGLDEQYLVFERQGLPKNLELDLTMRFGRVDRWLIDHGPQLKKTRFRNKSDAYTLINILLRHADRLPRSPEAGSSNLVDRLVEFSSEVNDLKRSESLSENMSDDVDVPADREQVNNYLRAVERAASDRNSRIRRNDALTNVLTPIFRALDLEPLTNADMRWRDSTAKEVDETEDDRIAELAEAQRVLDEDVI